MNGNGKEKGKRERKKRKRKKNKNKNKEKKKRKKKNKKKYERPNPDFRVHQSPWGPGASPFFFLSLTPPITDEVRVNNKKSVSTFFKITNVRACAAVRFRQSPFPFRQRKFNIW